MVRKRVDISFIKSFGTQVRKKRNEKEMSMEKLAHLCEMEYSQISRIELGQINTSINTAKKISDALKIEVKDLFDF